MSRSPSASISPKHRPSSMEAAERSAMPQATLTYLKEPPPVPLRIFKKCLPLTRMSATPSLSKSVVTAIPHDAYAAPFSMRRIAPSFFTNLPVPSLR